MGAFNWRKQDFVKPVVERVEYENRLWLDIIEE